MLLKIQRALNLVDAIWTREERDSIINHRLPVIEAIRLFNTIAKRAVEVAHLCNINVPSSPKPTAQSKSFVAGLSNKIRHMALEDYVPDWTGDGSTKAGITLVQYAESRRQGIMDGTLRNTTSTKDS